MNKRNGNIQTEDIHFVAPDEMQIRDRNAWLETLTSPAFWMQFVLMLLFSLICLFVILAMFQSMIAR